MQFDRRWIARLLSAAVLVSAPSAWAQDQDADGTPDNGDTFPCNPVYSALAFAPAEGVSGTLAFEDLWPGPNDHDYNDVVLAYNYVYYLDAQGRVVRVVASYTPRALGGKLSTGFGLHLGIPASAVSSVTRAVAGGAPVALSPSAMDAEFTVDVSNDLREFFGGASGAINARTDTPRQGGQSVVVDIRLSTPQALFSANAPHDVFLFHTATRGHELHRHMYPGTSQMDQSIFGTGHDYSFPGRWFIDSTHIPSAIDLPVTADYPAEDIDITRLFPKIDDWATSGGVLSPDFYAVNVQTQHAYKDSLGRGALAPATPHRPTIDYACVATPVVTQSNVTFDASNIATIIGSDWTVPTNVTVTIDYDGPIQLFSLDLSGTIRPAGCTTSRCATLDLQVISDATIRGSGTLNADARGYLGSRQSGNGSRGRTRGNVTSGASYQTGGSHGGLAGKYGATVTPAYDSAKHPNLPGAGGTGHNSSDARYKGGNGGGVIKMSVGGRLTLDGLVSANGGRGGVYDCGGAGGAIWLQANELASSRTGVRVRANGAYGYYSGGGGGRVAIYGTPVGGFSITESVATVQGGATATGSSYYGGAGTVVHGTDASGQANLLVYAPNASYNSRAGDTRVGAFGVVRGVSGSVLTTDATLDPGTLIGKTLKPDAEGAQTFSIVANTANTITVGSAGLTGATATNRTFYVTDYETRYATVTVKGAAKVDTGYLDVVGAATLQNSASVDLYDFDADHLTAKDASLLSVYDINARVIDTLGSASVTVRNMNFTTATLAGSSRVKAWYPSTSRIYPLTMTGQDLTLTSGARLHVDALGYLGSRQSGNGSRGRTLNNATSPASYQTGGSHGGHGGKYGATVEASYGDLYQPTTAGSGGTGHNSSDARYKAGNGGGVLRVNLSGTLHNDGTLAANGGRGGVYDTGGAGGSIWVTASTVRRNTTGVGFYANGAYGYYSAGGGGRIAIHYGSLAGWTVSPSTVQAHGGATATGATYYGGPGSILWRGAGQPNGHLLIHANSNYRSRFSDTKIVPSAFDHVTLLGDSHVDTTTLQVAGNLTIADTSTLDMNSIGVSNLDMSGNTKLYGQGVVASQALLTGSARATLQTINTGHLGMSGSTILTGWLPTTSAIYPLYVIASTLDLGVSARIHVDALGYLGSRQSGNGSRGRIEGNATSGASYQTGGSHGGYGGKYGSTVTHQFGDLLQPVTAGGGGTGHNSSDARYKGGNGGGVLRLDVAQTFTLDGRISANGGRGGVYDAGGAGGSVWVNAGTILTTRTGSRIQANGAYGYYSAGGGGRIALYYNTLTGWTVDAATVQANGGATATGATYYGGPGPIVYQPTANARPSVLITAPGNYYSRFGRTQLGEFGKVSGISGSVLTSSRRLRPGVLTGMTLVPNAENEGATFNIVSNTASTITVQGSLTNATFNGATWYVSDYMTQFEDLLVQGDAEVEAGYLDVARVLRVADTSDLLASDVDALNYDQQGSARVYLKRLGFQDATLAGSARLIERSLNGTNLVMQGSSVINGWSGSTSVVYPVLVTATNLTIGASARIDAAGYGYLGSRQSGNGSRARTDGNVTSGASYQTGGSHGGLGGRYGSTVTPTYGNPDQPVTFGAGGTGHNSSDARYKGGNGGGVVRVDVSGVFTHDGVVDANGSRGGVYDTGGAGGSVWVTAGTLDGAGTFRADGAYGYYAGGGGGRVAVYRSGGGWAPTTSNLRANRGTCATGANYYGQAGTTRAVLQ